MRLFRIDDQDTLGSNIKRCLIVFLLLNSITIYLAIIFAFELPPYIEETMLKEVTIAFVRFLFTTSYLGVIVIQLTIIYFFIRGILIIAKKRKHEMIINKGVSVVVHSFLTILMMCSSFYLFIYVIFNVLADTFVS